MRSRSDSSAQRPAWRVPVVADGLRDRRRSGVGEPRRVAGELGDGGSAVRRVPGRLRGVLVAGEIVIELVIAVAVVAAWAGFVWLVARPRSSYVGPDPLSFTEAARRFTEGMRPMAAA